MPNTFFKFKQFIVHQDKTAMKVTTDSCLFGAWVAQQIVKDNNADARMLDIGTGTGLLSLMVAQQTTGRIDAIELDPEAIDQARENVNNSPWAPRLNVYEGDAKNYSFPHQYDFIFSNPPFYENELRSDNKKKNMAHHDDGLTLDELLLIIEKNLTPAGKFYLLLPYKRHDSILQIIRNSPFKLSQTILIRQTVNHDYFRIMLEGQLKGTSNNSSEIAIRASEQEYTSEFISLLKDYYLYL